MKSFEINTINPKLFAIAFSVCIILSFVLTGYIAVTTKNIFIPIGIFIVIVILVIVFFKKLLFLKLKNISFNGDSISIFGEDNDIAYANIVWYKFDNTEKSIIESLVFKTSQGGKYRIACYTKGDRENWEAFKAEFVSLVENKSPKLYNYYAQKKWNYVIWGLLTSNVLIPVFMVFLGLNRDQIIKIVPQMMGYFGITMSFIGTILINRKKKK